METCHHTPQACRVYGSALSLSGKTCFVPRTFDTHVSMSAYYTKDLAKRACRACFTSLIARVFSGLGKEDNHLQGFPKKCTCELVQHPKSELQCHVCELGKEKHEHVGEDVVMHGPLTVEETNRYLHKMSVLHRNTGHTVLWNIWCVPWKLGAQILELWTWLGTFSVQFVRSLNVGSLDRPHVSLEPTPPKWAVVQADNAF